MRKTMTLFVVQSCADPKDPGPTIASFTGVDDVILVQTVADVAETPKTTDWYAVLYDDERIDERLAAGLEVFVEQSDADVLVLLKLSGKTAYRSPRLFRSAVALRPDCLLPVEKNWRFETVLNGWVLSDDIG